jgi:glutamyl-tRNA synthetase
VEGLGSRVEGLLNDAGIVITDHLKLEKVIELVKERCVLMPDFVQQSSFFFKAPEILEVDAVRPKWNDDKKNFFLAYCDMLSSQSNWDASTLEEEFKKFAADKNIKAGELLLPYRVMLVGGKFGPPVFVIAEVLGKIETIARINYALEKF